MTFSTILLVLACLLLVGAVVLVLKPRWVAAVPAWVGMMLLYWGDFLNSTTMPGWKLALWTLATLIVVMLKFYQPSGEPDGRNTGNLYIGLGAMMGALVGIVLGSSFVVLATILGALLGMMAYSRTPHGKWIKFGNSIFIQYFCARCLPAIVAVSMIGMCAEAILFYIKTCYYYSV